MGKISIRKITLNDTDLIITWRNKPHVRNNFIYQETLTKEIHETWMKNSIDTKKAYQFIIEYNHAPVGTTYLRDIDALHKKAEFGIYIGEEGCLGKGIGHEATNKILEYGFNTLGLNKIFLRVLGGNIKAIHSYEKSGFVEEGVLKDECYLNGAFCDIVLMARFKKDECK